MTKGILPGTNETPLRRVLLQDLGHGKLDIESQKLRRAFEARGVPVDLFLEKRLRRGQVGLAPSTLVSGYVPVVESALRQMGKPVSKPSDYPESLRGYLERKVWTSTVREMRHLLMHDETAPVFVKPMDRVKVFTGQVVSGHWDLHVLAQVSQATRLYCSEVVDWKTEWRFFVVEGEIVGARHYWGDESVRPDRDRVREALGNFDGAPRAFAMDWGVLENGETALLEVNDGYSLGSYGLDDEVYCSVLETRWRELVA